MLSASRLGRLSPHVTHREPDSGDEEVEGAEGGIGRDIGDVDRRSTARHLHKENACQCRLSAAQHHCPLRAGLPAPDRGCKLKEARKDRPDAEDCEHRIHAFAESDADSHHGDDAGDEVKQLRLVAVQAAGALGVDEVGQRSVIERD